MISLQFSAENAVVVLLSCLIGMIVYRHSRDSHAGPQAKGDLATAIAAVATTILVLSFLFGMGDGSKSTGEEPQPTVSASGP
ncbi:hypothetical protein AB0N14_25335 [Streptomyces sp. NPDC051104]|uniref:hypothetical protein n=1 Tax=Streptomyces sp. NPDC051104 TaxID=3155044 RepID=UPI0034253D54